MNKTQTITITCRDCCYTERHIFKTIGSLLKMLYDYWYFTEVGDFCRTCFKKRMNKIVEENKEEAKE